VAALHFDPGRVRDEAERKRGKARLFDRALDGVEAFVTGGAAPMPGGGLPVLRVGSWAMQPNRRTGLFPLTKFLRRLARRMVVVMAPEHNTTSLCGFCAGPVKHPTAGKGAKRREFRGTVYCDNPTCASRGRLQNRDVHAAVNINQRWLVDYILGGSLGMVVWAGICDAGNFWGPGFFSPPSTHNHRAVD
jgi:hypothetical protein